MKRHCIGLLAITLLAGCASTPEALKENPENRKAITVAVPYQLAFKRITEGQRECLPQNFVPIGQVINDAQLYPDLKMATITLGASGIGTQIRQHLEIASKGENSTELVLFAGTRPQAFLDRYARWANGSRSCDV